MTAAASPAEATGLRVQAVFKSYEFDRRSISVLRDVNFTLAPGEAACITGPSGSGKTTLLNLVSGLDRADAGSIQLGGQEIQTGASLLREQIRRQQMGLVFQEHQLLPQLTVLENVLLPLAAGRGVGKTDRQQALELLDRVGLTCCRDWQPAQLSGGERQRVAVCRALIKRPALVLADEPTGTLDLKTATTVLELLLEQCRKHQAMLLCVTHLPELTECFPRRYQIESGQLVQLGQQSAAVRNAR